jgi:hypothetical protein
VTDEHVARELDPRGLVEHGSDTRLEGLEDADFRTDRRHDAGRSATDQAGARR